MTTELSHILIFKTNIRTAGDKMRIQHSLDASGSIQQWNIDLHDIDCVLRVVSDTLTPEEIISMIQNRGFECTELE